jgi:hypothetical protein
MPPKAARQSSTKRPRPASQGKDGGQKRTPHNVADPAAHKAEYKVKDIVGHAMMGAVKHWLVQWDGYEDAKHNTYEPVTNLAGCEDFIARYESELKDQIREQDKVAQQKADERAAEKKKQEDEQAALETASSAPSTEDSNAMDNYLSNNSTPSQNRRRSWVWVYFDASRADPDYELCNLPDRKDPTKRCLTPIKKCGGPSPFRSHILYCHKTTFQEHEPLNTLFGDSGGQQTTLEVPGRADISAAKRDALHLRVSCWIVRRNRPVAIGELDTELRDVFLEATNGAYQLPDHHIVNANILRMSAEGVKNLKAINANLKKQGLKPSIAGILTS